MNTIMFEVPAFEVPLWALMLLYLVIGILMGRSIWASRKPDEDIDACVAVSMGSMLFWPLALPIALIFWKNGK